MVNLIIPSLCHQRSNIIIIDDSKLKQQFLKNILKNEYQVFTFSSEKEATPHLEAIAPSCMLMDMERPGEDGLETIYHFKHHPTLSDVPIILITSTDDVNTEQRVLDLGCADYVGNRFAPEIIRVRVRNQVELYRYKTGLEKLVEEKTKGILELQDAIMLMLSDLVECRDEMTSGHAERTRNYVERLLRQLKANGSYLKELTPKLIQDLIRAAPLHDMGKVGIPDSILNKPGRLTEEEFDAMKLHTVIGANAIMRAMKTIKDNSFLKVLREVVLSHHERWDGSGYPLGLAGLKIPISGRVMAIPDVYDALVSARPYKKPFSHEEAVHIIKSGIGSHFDPLIGEAFLQCETDFALINQSLLN